MTVKLTRDVIVGKMKEKGKLNCGAAGSVHNLPDEDARSLVALGAAVKFEGK